MLINRRGFLFALIFGADIFDLRTALRQSQ
jgi:hypothetical protein